MAKLNKDDLVQMDKNYFQSITKERLVEVAANLHQLAVEQCERLEQNSSNSSRPPSTDNPYQTKNKKKEDVDDRREQEKYPEEPDEDESLYGRHGYRGIRLPETALGSCGPDLLS